jgi:hypothetical protein
MENQTETNRNKRKNAKDIVDFLSTQNLSDSTVVLKNMMEKFSMTYANAYYFFRKVRKSHKDIVQG